MPFKSMFGLYNLLKEYGVGSIGVQVDGNSKAEALSALQTPFLADTPDGFAIVLSVANGKVRYDSQNKIFTASIEEMANGWNGIALLATADGDACEPNYEKHHVGEILNRVKYWVLCALAVILPCYAMCATGLYRHYAAWLLLALNVAGLAFSWMLVQKSMGVHTAASEAVCSVLEEGGCDEIARSEASSFLGIFKWSEVGLAYFGVSLGALLLFPTALPALAAINILCLPYTVWSIYYQGFKAKTWCTLCVCVQVTLWLLFFSYLLSGATAHVLPLSVEVVTDFLVLGCCFVGALFGINRLDNSILKYFKPKNDDNSEDSES